MNRQLMRRLGAVALLVLCSPLALANSLLNVDFGTGTVSGKKGPAALGETADDFWNHYTRDDTNGSYRTFGKIENALWSDGKASTADITVRNAPGAWGSGATDAMMATYLYPFDSEPIGITVSELPAGRYALSVYAHGNTESLNSVIEAKVGEKSFGSKSTSASGDWNQPNWVDGKQFALFDEIEVPVGQTLTLTIARGAGSAAVVNGLQLFFKGVIPPASTLLNVDFGIGTVSQKKGPAAMGVTAEDVWNLFSRDDGSGGWRTLGQVENALWSDGKASTADITVRNAPGAWGSGATDAMMATYLYPFDSEPIGITVSDLPAGRYALCVYAHGNTESLNSVVEAKVGEKSFGSKSTSASGDWNQPNWVDGKQFVLFDGIEVLEGQTLTLTIARGAGSAAVVNGLQLFFKGAIPPRSTLLNVDFGIGTVSQKKGPAAMGVTAEDVWNLFSRDDGNGGWRTLGRVENALWSDGKASTVDFTVRNAPGAWGSGATDAMMATYLYPLDSEPIGITVSELPAGRYALCLYAHGNTESLNSVIEAKAEEKSFGSKSTSASGDWNQPNWVDGKQFVLFDEIEVLEGQTLTLTIARGAGSAAVVNGLQLLLKDAIFSKGTVLHVVSSSPPASIECATAPAALVGWWKGDSNANDSAGAHHALVTAGITYAEGKVGTAFSFDGSSEVTVPNHPDFNFSTFSIEGWVFPTSLDGGEDMIACKESIGFLPVTFQLGIRGSGFEGEGTIPVGNLAYYLGVNGAPADHHLWVNGGGPVASNEWTHVALVFDGSSARTYVNGELKREVTGLTGPLNISSGPIRIGSRSDPIVSQYPRERFNGRIDELSVYARALTTAEVRGIFGAQTAGKCPLAPTPPAITQQPRSITAIVGAAASFSVGVSGSSPLTYQWSKDGVEIAGATAPTLAFASVQSSDAGKYTVRVSNSLGVAISDDATLTVTIAPERPNITSQPQPLTVPVGGRAEFSVQATGTEPITYQWRRNGFSIPGANQATFAIDVVQFGNAGSYTVRVSNSVGGITSAPATLTVVDAPLAPSISAHPATQSISAGAGAAFAVTASGTQPLTYQWYFNGAPLENAKSATFGIPAAQTAHAGTYWVVVSNSAGSATSAGAVLNVSTGESGGTVTFNNRLTTGPNAPVFDTDGTTPLAGIGFLAQLYAGPDASTLAPVGSAVPFRTGVVAGYVDVGTGANRVITTVAPGGTAAVQVRAWESARGSTFEQAAGALGKHGASAILVLVTGGNGSPPTVPAELIGLASFALVQAPLIGTQPADVTVLEGERVLLSVGATGSATLKYQWQLGDTPIDGATQATYEVAAATSADAGAYRVVVTNDVGSATSSPATVVVRVPDRTPPAITLAAPVAGPTPDERFTVQGVITDNVAVTAARWQWNDRAAEQLSLTDGSFSVGPFVLLPGENRIKVTAVDAAGNEAVAEVALGWAPRRILALGSASAQQEGGRLVLPIELTSDGDVAGMTLVIRYDPEFLRDPEAAWSTVLDGAFKEFNTATPGELRASFALPATSIPAGTHSVATVSFRARSVPQDLTTAVNVEIRDISSAAGNPITFGTDTRGSSARITKRLLIGDNNANQRLDVGDATVVLRLVTLLDAPRAWDIPANDLNVNAALDSGDVIRVLRAVVGIDPQPQIPGPARSASLASVTSTMRTDLPRLSIITVFPSGRATLAISPSTAVAGELVKVQVKLEDLKSAVSGGVLTLSYPTNALRLQNSAAHTAGALVPPGALTIWNVAPSQNDYAAQTGRISMAATSPSAWPATNGVLAELTFEVQANASAQYRWPIELSGVEVTPDGFETRLLPGTSSYFIGRDPVSPTIASALSSEGGAIELAVRGELGVSYALLVSDDLNEWKLLDVLIATNGEVRFVDPEAAKRSYRFYRVRQQD